MMIKLFIPETGLFVYVAADDVKRVHEANAASKHKGIHSHVYTSQTLLMVKENCHKIAEAINELLLP